MAWPALIRDPEAYIECGPVRLVPNSYVEWLVLRDVPPGYFPGSRDMNRREVNWATRTQARLRHGMPCIDFIMNPRDSWDFRCLPFDHYLHRSGPRGRNLQWIEAAGDILHSRRYAREFAVLNQISAEMTRYAFCATDAKGMPCRPAWACRCPGRFERSKEPLRQAFPVPYLAFRRDKVEQLFALATQSRAESSGIECSGCGRFIELEVFQQKAGRLRMRFLETGDWLACCPHCHSKRKWHLQDVVEAKVRRQFPRAFQERFCRDLAEGLPLKSIGPCLYRGVRPVCDDPPVYSLEERGLPLNAHWFVNMLTRSEHWVCLPRTARVHVKVEQELVPGAIWAHVLDHTPDSSWLAMKREDRWKSLHLAVRDSRYVGLFQRIWFEHQALYCEDLGDHQMAWRADLVQLAAHQIRPLGLFWGFGPTSEFLDIQSAAVVLPPMRLRRWDGFRMRLPAEVDLDASIVDPRFCTNRRDKSRKDEGFCDTLPMATSRNVVSLVA